MRELRDNGAVKIDVGTTTVLAAVLGALACVGSPRPSRATDVPPEERLRVRVVNTLPHSRDSFTQGLLIVDGTLYESAGRYGQSRLRRIDLQSGRVLAEVWLRPDLFGEGLARVGDQLVQLTWQEGLALRWTLPGMAPAGERHYEGEGWGLTFDGERLVMSDGSARLTFRHPDTFGYRGAVTVTREGRPVEALNELEWAEQAVWANVLGADEILRIDPTDGRVTAVVDASGLLEPPERAAADVLNGIAYDPESRRFWLTGKLWPRLFEVELVPAER